MRYLPVITDRWFQPSWKICLSNWIISQSVRVENKDIWVATTLITRLAGTPSWSMIPSTSLLAASLLPQVAQALPRRLDHFVDLSLPNVSPRTVPNPQTSGLKQLGRGLGFPRGMVERLRWWWMEGPCGFSISRMKVSCGEWPLRLYN